MEIALFLLMTTVFVLLLALNSESARRKTLEQNNKAILQVFGACQCPSNNCRYQSYRCERRLMSFLSFRLSR